MQKYIYCHFESEVYKVFIEDVLVTLIDIKLMALIQRKDEIFGWIHLRH